MRRGASLLVCMVLSATLACVDDHCLVTEQALSEEDLLWGVPVAEEVESLLGPFEGTWTWESGQGIVEVPEAGTSIPVTVHVELDPDSYRFVETEFVDGNLLELFPDREDPCMNDDPGFHADGVMTVLDENGETVVSVPLPIWRRTQRQAHSAEVSDAPLSSISAQLHPVESFDEQALHVDVDWDPNSASLFAEFHFIGRIVLPDTPEGRSRGGLVWADVATLEMP